MNKVCFEAKAIDKNGELICTSLWNSEEEHSSEDTYIKDIKMVVVQMRDIWNPARIVIDIAFPLK